jgi:tetratricopeptide (TPR) repeat protein
VKTALVMRQAVLGAIAEAESNARQIIQVATKRFGPEDSSVILGQYALADVLIRAKRLDESIDVFREASAKTHRVFGDAHPITTKIDVRLSRLLGMLGRMDEAQRVLEEFNQRRSIATGERFYGHGLWLINAILRAQAGQVPDGNEVIKQIRAAAGINDRSHTEGGGWPRVLPEAMRLLKDGELEELIALLEQDWQRLRASGATDDDRLILLPETLGCAYSAAGRHADALPLKRSAYEASLQRIGRKPWGTHEVLRGLCFEIAALGNRDEDLAYVAAELERHEQAWGDEPSAVVHAYELAVAGLWSGPNCPDRVVEWARLTFEKARAANVTSLWRYGMQVFYAEVLFQAGDLDEAIKNSQEAIAGYTSHTPLLSKLAAHYWLSRHEAMLAAMLAARNPSEKAVAELADRCESLLKMYQKSDFFQVFSAGQNRRILQRAIGRLIDHLQAAGRTEEADAWRAKLAQLSTARGTP